MTRSLTARELIAEEPAAAIVGEYLIDSDTSETPDAVISNDYFLCDSGTRSSDRETLVQEDSVVRPKSIC